MPDARLDKYRKYTYETLCEEPQTRSDDGLLTIRVLTKLGVDTSRPFDKLTEAGMLNGTETITRMRRKLQEEYPELRSITVAERRAKNRERFENYMKHFEKELTL